MGFDFWFFFFFEKLASVIDRLLFVISPPEILHIGERKEIYTYGP